MIRYFVLSISLVVLTHGETPQVQQPATSTLPENLATHPLPRDEKWLKKHESINEISKQGRAPLVFLGDSITQGWSGKGKASWDQKWAPLGAANFGISGDRTEHVLWRLQHGNFDGLKPKAIVLMIGTNNTGHVGKAYPELNGSIYHCTPEQTASGIKLILHTLQTKMPDTKILLLGIFPRGELPTDPMRLTNAEINTQITKLADGQKIIFKDIGSTFVAADGKIDKAIMYDFLHLTEKGYELFAAAIEQEVMSMLGK
jgi:lysophospholipase L1-like esterase